MNGGYRKASIISIGNELLSGRTVDTNAAYIAGQLRTVGIPVVSVYSVADEEPAIRRKLALALGGGGCPAHHGRAGTHRRRPDATGHRRVPGRRAGAPGGPAWDVAAVLRPSGHRDARAEYDSGLHPARGDGDREPGGDGPGHPGRVRRQAAVCHAGRARARCGTCSTPWSCRNCGGLPPAR